MFLLADFPFSIDQSVLHRQLNIKPGTDSAKELAGFLDHVESIARPKAIYLDSFIETKSIDSVTLEGMIFQSPSLRMNLDQVNRIFPYIATCGSEVDSIDIDRGDLIRQMWLYSIKLSLLQVSLDKIRQDIQRKYKFAKLSSMNPGSGEASVWPIEQQQDLFSIFKGAEACIGVTLTPSYLMQPDISTSGIFFPAETTFQNCQLCQREICDYRQAPFDRKMWDSIHSPAAG